MISIIESTLEHAVFLGPRLREGDMREVMIVGMTGEEAISMSMKHSFVSRTAMFNDEPVAMWGAGTASPMHSAGFVWALTGCRVPSLAKYLLPVSRDFVEEMLGLFNRIEAMVDPEYSASRRWLGWLGFQEGGECLYNGARFISAYKEA